MRERPSSRIGDGGSLSAMTAKGGISVFQSLVSLYNIYLTVEIFHGSVVYLHGFRQKWA